MNLALGEPVRDEMLWQTLFERLERIEKRLSLSTVKESYTTQEVAERVGRSEWTVRQWANKGKVQAKKVHGRGRQGEWRIPHDELARLQNEGPKAPGTFPNS